MVGGLQLLAAAAGVIAIVQMDEVLARLRLAVVPGARTSDPAWFVTVARLGVGVFVLYQLRLAFIEYV